ncbi:hypothetical protein MFIFM68171_02667 [Madurella fahalii]|uniref:Uncharacterized protein n=1 Tax=Madurella fahalii TaxID=1157608 RepID=A0ABQ0G3W1_9PEZI
MSKVTEPTGESGQVQPWRAWWPPTESAVRNMSEEERKAKPWVNWKPDPQRPNAKPWLQWVPRDAHLIDPRPHVDGDPAAPQQPIPHPKPNAPVPPSSNAEGG